MRVSILMLMLMLMCICMYFLLRSLADLHERRAARALEELLAHQQGAGGCDHHEHNNLYDHKNSQNQDDWADTLYAATH